MRRGRWLVLERVRGIGVDVALRLGRRRVDVDRVERFARAVADGRGAAPVTCRQDQRQGHDTRSQMHDSRRSEEHTSELQSLMRISYAVFCLKNKTHIYNHHCE